MVATKTKKNSSTSSLILQITKEQFMDQLAVLAASYGYVVHHDKDTHLVEAGFPDLLLWKAGKGLVYLTCLSQREKLSEPQNVWIERMRASWVRAGFVRPKDWEWLEAILSGDRDWDELWVHP